MVVSYNPDLDPDIRKASTKFNGSMLGLAIQIYPHLLAESCKLGVHRDLILDGKTHTLGHYDTDEAFAFNFLAPLLIECGVPFNTEGNFIMQTIPLHAAEKDYLRSCATYPRSLKLTCKRHLETNIQRTTGS